MTTENPQTPPLPHGTQRAASRLGNQALSISTPAPELQDRKDWQDSLIRKNVTEFTGYEFLPVGEEQNPDDPKPVFELPQIGITGLHPIGSGSVYYYHSNHLGSTCYVTDGNASVVQGFLYAPFGEITNEYNSSWQSGNIPKYAFNAKELDEETGFYYYEARYYAPPMFISRDPLFEKYPTFSPYAYCVNNPVKYVDPDGRDTIVFNHKGLFSNRIQASGRHMGRVLDKNGNKRFDFEFACQLDADRCCRPGSPEEEKIMGRDKLPHGKNCPEEERVPIYQIELVWPNDIISQIEASGACNNIDHPVLYALFQSSDGKLDFANNNRKKGVWNENTLYIPMVPGKKYAHNVSNMGNFLWGAAMQKMGIGKIMTFLGSNLHAKWKHGEYDSFDDQLSIWLGYSYGSSIQTNRKK